MEALQLLDQNILLFIQEHIRLGWLNPIMVVITHLGEAGIMWIVLGLVMMFFKKTRRGGLIMLICLAFAWVINDFVLKELFARARPFNTIEGLTILVKAPGSFSFPSGHSNASFACALALTMLYGKKGAWSFIPAALIALSRCYVGVHYPTDILTGAIVGTLLSLAAYKLVIYVEGRYKLKKEQALPKENASGEAPGGDNKQE